MPTRSSHAMRPADWLYVGLSVLMQVLGVLGLAALSLERWWPLNEGLRFVCTMLLVWSICALVGLHLLGVVWQWRRPTFLRPLPVVVCLCLDVLVSILLIGVPYVLRLL
jgi:cell division protein FtsW (lipid II flippase)